MFNRLISLPGAFGRDHKHMFNEFGIKLRRSGLLDEALRFYAIAFKISNNDDHLLYNIARTLFDKGDYTRCLSYLEHTLKLNPKLMRRSSFYVRQPRRLPRVRAGKGYGQDSTCTHLARCRR